MWKYILVPSAVIVASYGAAPAYAQQPVQLTRFEAGVQVTSPRLREFNSRDRVSEIGIGGRFTANLTRFLAAEAELDVYPDDQLFPGRRELQGLFGVRTGLRTDRFGVFAKFRPGFMHVSSRAGFPFCAIPEWWDCKPPVSPVASRLWLAVDMGGVFEVYPSRRLAVRVDIGDTLIRRWLGSDLSRRDYYFTSHNLQVTTGAAFRF